VASLKLRSNKELRPLVRRLQLGRSLDRAGSRGYPDIDGPRDPRMRQFKWIEWNLQKIDAHGLSADEVEAAFDRVFNLQERKDGSFQMFAATPSGRRIWVIWRYDREDDEIPDVFGELADAPIFVITAY
jgi:hypothetical protein